MVELQRAGRILLGPSTTWLLGYAPTAVGQQIEKTELYAAVSIGVEALGLQSGLRDIKNNRQPGCSGSQCTSGSGVGETRAHETSLVASGEGCRPAGCGDDSNRAKSS